VAKEVYADISLPINKDSIVGYVAENGEMLEIDDAYAIDPGMPFHFNRDFDNKTGYRTTSILTIPVKSFESKLVGVIQIINAKDRQGRPIPFTREAKAILPLFANQAATAIESGIMTRELILRMMKMAELRDPSETGAHVQRVGAYAAEIYHQWARDRGVDEKELARTKDKLRIAAMLHDVGKVGISDMILKKPGRLTDDERNVMKSHTLYGAQLFANSTSELDRMCGEIAAGHHEKWDGSGYPGRVVNLQDMRTTGNPVKGEDIPISARITALADVFDALSSKRCYKEEWSQERVLGIINQDAGKHFDPEVVEAFLAIYDVIEAIRHKYRENGERDVDSALEFKAVGSRAG
jgi:HD-GYP domain-containing protein (c-di-GMP phosphodiesterase class II)